MKILFLTTEGHGQIGGIAQSARDIIASLSRWQKVEKVDVLTRLMERQDFNPPPKAEYLRRGPCGVFTYMADSAQAALWNDYQLVYCTHINLLPAAYLASRIARCPLLLLLHGIEAWQPPATAAAWLARHGDFRVASVSRLTAKRFCAWSGRKVEGIAILPNGICPEDYGAGPRSDYLVQRYGLERRRVIMTLGRMPSADRQKGFDETLAAVAGLLPEMPDLVYLLVGDGPDRARLENKASELGITQAVRFTGRITETEKADHYRLCDAYVMPSTGEGFGFVVIEALACGIPVVASRIDGTFEALREGALGQVVDPADGPGLIAAIRAAVAEEKCVPEGLAHFAFPAFDERLHGLITQIMGGGKALDKQAGPYSGEKA